MSTEPWTQMPERRLSRRTMLNWTARLGLGAAGLALVGCGGDDDDADDAPSDQTQSQPPPPPEPGPDREADAEPAPTPQPGPDAPALTIVIEEIALAGTDGTVTLINTSNSPINLDGWFVCQRPSYFPLPGATTIGPGERLILHAGDGDNTATDIFAAGGMGRLGDSGEIALYTDRAFDNENSIVAYVGWGNGGGRRSVAQRAGLWGDANLDASEGDLICWTGDDIGIDNYSRVAGGAATAAPSDDETAMASGKVIIQNLAFVNEGVVRLQNMSTDTVSLDGWWLCQFPNYWPIPSVDLAPAAQLRIRLGAGDDTADTLHAAGAVARLDAGGGEMALYNGPAFEFDDAIISYVAWGGGGGRLNIAQSAGIWGDNNLTVVSGNVVSYTGAGIGADGYQISDSGTEGVDF